MTLEMSSEAVLLTCPMLGMNGRPCPMSTSHHLVVNLANIHRTPKKSLPTKGNVCAFYNQNTDWDVIHLGESSFAGCPACAGRHRKHTYDENCRRSLPDDSHPPTPSTPGTPQGEVQPPPGLPAPIPVPKKEEASETPRERVQTDVKRETEGSVPRKRVTFSDEPVQGEEVKKEEEKERKVKVEKKEEAQGGKELLYRKIQDKLF